MLNLSWQQIRERVDSLPPILKEALFSYKNSVKIRSICKFHHLDDEKISQVADLVGEVLMGFRPIDEFKKSLNEDLPVLGQTIINSLSERINKEIFQPIKDQIEENYSPVVVEIKRKEETKEEEPEEEKIKQQEKEPKKENKIEEKPKEELRQPEKEKEDNLIIEKQSQEQKISSVNVENKEKEFSKTTQPQPIKIKEESSNKKNNEPFMLFKSKRPTIKRKPLSFWFKEKIKKEEEPIKTEIEMANNGEQTSSENIGTKEEKEINIKYQKPEEKESPFENK